LSRSHFYIFLEHEVHSYLAAQDATERTSRHNLKNLRTLVSGAVIFSGTQETNIIDRFEMIHEVRDELFSRKTAPCPISEWDDRKESPVR
jgi:hypothetical protein